MQNERPVEVVTVGLREAGPSEDAGEELAHGSSLHLSSKPRRQESPGGALGPGDIPSLLRIRAETTAGVGPWGGRRSWPSARQAKLGRELSTPCSSVCSDGLYRTVFLRQLSSNYSYLIGTGDSTELFSYPSIPGGGATTRPHHTRIYGLRRLPDEPLVKWVEQLRGMQGGGRA